MAREQAAPNSTSPIAPGVPSHVAAAQVVGRDLLVHRVGLDVLGEVLRG